MSATRRAITTDTAAIDSASRHVKPRPAPITVTPSSHASPSVQRVRVLIRHLYMWSVSVWVDGWPLYQCTSTHQPPGRRPTTPNTHQFLPLPEDPRRLVRRVGGLFRSGVPSARRSIRRRRSRRRSRREWCRRVHAVRVLSLRCSFRLVAGRARRVLCALRRGLLCRRGRMHIPNHLLLDAREASAPLT
jgi:hypothetical protein